MVRTVVRSHLYNSSTDERAIAFERVAWATGIHEPARTNCFAITWIANGHGSVDVDATAHPFEPHTLLFVSPYRHVRLVTKRPLRGATIRFHANFLCVETFHAESGCSGVLFNDPFGSPLAPVPRVGRADVRRLVERIASEMQSAQTGSGEVVTASLKILLVMATRWKNATAVARGVTGADHRHPLLQRLSELVELHYRTLHAPAQYARLLHMTPKALGRFTRAHFGRTMTEVIRERLIIDAKWDLLHTLKPVKQIANELGFADELYFSRFFKKATGQAPTSFREFETEIRGGSNLSMSLARPTIPAIRVDAAT
jgi:AraC family transcriptional activator of pobA